LDKTGFKQNRFWAKLFSNKTDFEQNSFQIAADFFSTGIMARKHVSSGWLINCKVRLLPVYVQYVCRLSHRVTRLG
jgi:hypothetical protein